MSQDKPRESTEEKIRKLTPDWLTTAAAEVKGDLYSVAAKYPDRFEFRNGTLRPKREPRA